MNDAVIIAGPTAVGKTEYSIDIAKAINGEIVSADSMQLYKYMNIGSAKPTIEERNYIKHHLVDEIDPRERFSVAMYQELAKKAINEIFNKNKVPVICGGTGLYINSLIYEMDFAGGKIDNDLRNELFKLAEEKGAGFIHNMLRELDNDAAERIHPNNIKKIVRAIESVKLSGKQIKSFDKSKVPAKDISYSIIGLIREREELYNRINIRVETLFNLGLVAEVEELLKMGLTVSDISMKGIGYKEVISYINGEYSIDECKELVKTNTRHLAKKQITWLKSYENIKWINLSNISCKEEALEEILSWLKKNQ